MILLSLSNNETIIEGRKKSRNDPDKRKVEQTKLNNYWLNSPIETSYKFQELDNQRNDNKDDTEI